MTPQIAADIGHLVDEFSPPPPDITKLRQRVAGLSRRALTARRGDSIITAYNAALRELNDALADRSVVSFEDAAVGDEAYTWELADGHDFGDYRYETAGNPVDLYGEENCPVVRKRWRLMEVVELPEAKP